MIREDKKMRMTPPFNGKVLTAAVACAMFVSTAQAASARVLTANAMAANAIGKRFRDASRYTSKKYRSSFYS